jgi:isoaspartyl peptidase/L-asparaginase-like protein (Ntn-hydrolase superfamily)
MSAPGSALPCMPPDSQRGASCPRREDWSEEERAAWEAWSSHHCERMLAVFAALPGDNFGKFPCPACGTGTVSYVRSRSNGHLHAACSTPHCFAVMQ